MSNLKSKCSALLRSKKLMVVSLIVITVFLLHGNFVPEEPLGEINIVESRVIDPCYKLDSRLSQEQKCNKFFKNLKNYQPQGIAKSLQEFDYNLYDKKNYLSDTIKAAKFQLADQNIKFTEDVKEQIKLDYFRSIKKLSSFENDLLKDFNVMRIHASCNQLVDLSKFDQKLYPWLNSPLQNSTGKGIVIPVLPVKNNYMRDQQIIKLIKTLRILKNKLPVQLVYFGDTMNQEPVNNAATEEILVPESYTNSSTPFDYPKQDIKFIDIKQSIDRKYHHKVNANFIYSASLIFNTFEEIILLSHQTIPLTDPEKLFENEDYVKTGTMFFKNPALLSTKPRKPKNGYNEVNLLIQSLLPHDKDVETFELIKPNSDAVNRILNQGFQKFVDPSMMVINKAKCLDGLLIATNLQFINLLNGRFHNFQSELNPDFIWLGQEIAGQHETNFNNNYAVAGGVLTPPLSKDRKLLNQSEELCSSSWGQIYDVDNFTLLYVTTHQLENAKWLDDLFLAALEGKYSYHVSEVVDNIFDKGSDVKQTLGSINAEVYKSKLAQNPLYIETVIKPPTLNAPVVIKDATEPKQAWILQEGFVNDQGNPYYCAYNIVGNLVAGRTGSMITFNDSIQKKFKFIIDFWLQD